MNVQRDDKNKPKDEDCVSQVLQVVAKVEARKSSATQVHVCQDCRNKAMAAKIDKWYSTEVEYAHLLKVARFMKSEQERRTTIKTLQRDYPDRFYISNGWFARILTLIEKEVSPPNVYDGKKETWIHVLYRLVIRWLNPATVMDMLFGKHSSSTISMSTKVTVWSSWFPLQLSNSPSSSEFKSYNTVWNVGMILGLARHRLVETDLSIIPHATEEFMSHWYFYCRGVSLKPNRFHPQTLDMRMVERFAGGQLLDDPTIGIHTLSVIATTPFEWRLALFRYLVSDRPDALHFSVLQRWLDSLLHTNDTLQQRILWLLEILRRIRQPIASISHGSDHISPEDRWKRVSETLVPVSPEEINMPIIIPNFDEWCCPVSSMIPESLQKIEINRVLPVQLALILFRWATAQLTFPIAINITAINFNVNSFLVKLPPLLTDGDAVPCATDGDAVPCATSPCATTTPCATEHEKSVHDMIHALSREAIHRNVLIVIDEGIDCAARDYFANLLEQESPFSSRLKQWDTAISIAIPILAPDVTRLCAHYLVLTI